MPSRAQPVPRDLWKMAALSLALHALLVVFFSLNPRPPITKAKPTGYTVTLVSVAVPEPETRFKAVPFPEVKEEAQKPVQKPKKEEIIEKVKKPQKKVETPPPKVESQVDLKRLEEALEEIRKKIALDELRKKVARRETPPERSIETATPAPVISAGKSLPEAHSKLNEYYSAVWAKIKRSWTIPEYLRKERVDLETIVVIIIERDGTVRKAWFEKRSGDDLYDQMAMRAVKKAEPLPPIPKELSEESLEIGIRFLPEER